MKTKILLFILFCGLLGTCTLKPDCPVPMTQQLVLKPGSEGKDAHISNLTPVTPGGNYNALHTRSWTVGGNLSIEKGLIQFDYAAIPAGVTITKATLTLFADTITNSGSIGHSTLSGPNDWSLKRITQSWSESSVTWNTVPATDNTSSIFCPASTFAFQNYTIDVTSFVKEEIANPTLYYGFLMEINNLNPYRAVNFCSSDNADASLHPKMVIEYKK